jgi:hypothetical protein
MDRKQLIDRIVSRKLASKGTDKIFCVCLAVGHSNAGGRQAPKK